MSRRYDAFYSVFFNHGMYKGRRIINKETAVQMYNEYPVSDEWIYNFGLDVRNIKGRILLNHNGGGFGFLATQDILINSGFGAAALTNSTDHSNVQNAIIRNVWDDLFALQDAKEIDCEHIPEKYKPIIGLYEAKFNGGSWKLAVIPRNGAIYCNNLKLEQLSSKLFFNENSDCIEFTDNGLIYDNVVLYKNI